QVCKRPNLFLLAELIEEIQRANATGSIGSWPIRVRGRGLAGGRGGAIRAAPQKTTQTLQDTSGLFIKNFATELVHYSCSDGPGVEVELGLWSIEGSSNFDKVRQRRIGFIRVCLLWSEPNSLCKGASD